jgi:hypothetical protein
VSRIFFAPLGMLGGLIAGLLGKRLFNMAWALVDENEPPQPGDREAAWRRVLLALLLQGAIFRASRGVMDRVMRKGFSYLTGSWPGERKPPKAAS